MCSKKCFYFKYFLIICLLVKVNSDDLQTNANKNEIVFVEDVKQDDNVQKLDEPIKGIYNI
jgi:hypothetical protein